MEVDGKKEMLKPAKTMPWLFITDNTTWGGGTAIAEWNRKGAHQLEMDWKGKKIGWSLTTGFEHSWVRE
ncbi:hypothetical protein [Kibdelosporangium philippinense]